MSEYYLDIETNASQPPDIENDEILTIQFQRLGTETGGKEADLTILESWDSSEEDILVSFHSTFEPNDHFKFIPIGMNLNFDLLSLHYRWKRIGIDVPLKNLLHDHPYIDIKPILVILNRGSFKGASLQEFTGKKHSGAEVAKWYAENNYAAIEEYVRDEANRFTYLYQFLKRESTDMRCKWFEKVLPSYKAQVV